MAEVSSSRAGEVPGRGPEVRIVTAESALDVLLAELRAALDLEPPGLVSFATGNTYVLLLQRLAAELAARRFPVDRLRATHLDEYLGFTPEQRGGMVHELEQHCPQLRELRRGGRFLPVPADGRPESLRAHEERLRRAGGVHLQLLGIGRNGHVAFNEPGSPFDLGFHAVDLAATTREDSRARFAPAEPPLRACTAGIASILASRRIVLCAFGRAKAAAVRAMLEGVIGPACPASAIRLHAGALVLLDREAAGEPGRSLGRAVG
jgi:glucosamine-6-phosphate deaminase